MDYLDPNKKRRKRARIMIGYGLLGLVIAVATVVLVYVTSGYYVDRSTGEVIQNGLIYVDTKPESAKVFINDVEQGSRTDARLVLPEGDYTIRLERDGYRSWERTVDLGGGSLRRLNYARLIPQDLETAPVRTLPEEPSVASQSIDKRWLVMAFDDNALEMRFIDLQSAQLGLQDLKLPVDLIVSDSLEGTWEILEWADDNKTFLASYTTEDGIEYVLVNRDKPAESLNVAASLGDVTYDSVTLRNRKKDLLYAYDSKSGALQKVRVGSDQAEGVARRIVQYTSFGEDTLYVINDAGDKTKANVILRLGNKQEFTLRSLPRADEYILDLSKIGSAYVAAVSSAEEDKVYVFNDPLASVNRSVDGTSKASTIFNMTPDELHISTDSSAVVARQGQSFASYEFEEDHAYTFEIEEKLDKKQEIRWVDGRHFTIGIGGVQHIIDYNGDNQYELVSSVASFGSFFGKDLDELFTFSAASGKDEDEVPARMLRTFLRSTADR